MSFQPSQINYEAVYNIPGTDWSMLQHTHNLYFFYNQKYTNFKARKDTISEETHISMFVRRDGVDHHATYIYTDKNGKHYKRHYGYRYRNNRQQFKLCRNPSHLKSLFEQFEKDLPSLGIPNYIKCKMVRFE